MFFKNIIAYQITGDFNPLELNEKLSSKPATACHATQLSTYGFINPTKHSEDFAYQCNGSFLICAQEEAKQLPSSVIKDEVQKKVDQIELNEARKVYKKERDQLKDEVILDMMPRAFIKTTRVYALVMPEANLILVNTASASKAEEILSAMREAIGSLPARPVSVNDNPSVIMTSFVRGDLDEMYGFTIGSHAELKDSCEQGATIHAKNEDLESEEIQGHLSTGKVVTSLQLHYQDMASFTINEKMVIKQLKIDDIVTEKEDDDLDAAGIFESELAIAVGFYAKFIDNLVSEFGGYQEASAI